MIVKIIVIPIFPKPHFLPLNPCLVPDAHEIKKDANNPYYRFNEDSEYD